MSDVTLTGPDISHHQGVVDMRAVHDEGRHTFVGIKATEGTSYIDPQFRRNRDHARDVGLIRLLYHFGRPGKVVTEADARSEAAYFFGAIGELEPGEVAVLDIEDSAVAAGVNLGPWSLAFLDEIDRRTGRAGGSAEDDAVVYTYGPFASAHLRLSNRLGDRDLWLAAYSASPRVSAPWRSWTFWQWTSNGTCPGIAGRCDLNKFTGPIEALHRIAGITPVEDDMYEPTDRARDENMAKQVQEIHDAIYKGHPEFMQPGIEGSVAEIHKKVVG